MAVSLPVEALAAAEASGLLPAGSTLLVACSGGRDSMALLHALATSDRWDLHVATVDHGWHPDARAHADWVVSQAAARGVEAHRLVVDPDRVRHGPGPEAAARAERYRLLRAHASSIGARRLVLAHTADDQAETLLMRVGEGTGLRGLGGMRARRGLIARPWLGVERRAVAAYAAAAGVEWVTDPSNADERYRRNAVRARVMPGMDAVFGGDWCTRVARSARHAQGALDLLEWCLGEHGLRLVSEHDDAIIIDRAASNRLPTAAREAVVAHALHRAAERWSPESGRRVALHVPRLLGARAMISLPGRLRARGTADWIRIEPLRAVEAAGPPTRIAQSGRYIWGSWCVVIDHLPHLPDAPVGDFIAVAGAVMPWQIRAARPGDRFRPLGAPGHKAVTRLWRDAAVPRERRAGLPVIEADGGLLWVGELRAGEGTRAGRDEPVWQVRLERRDGMGADDDRGG